MKMETHRKERDVGGSEGNWAYIVGIGGKITALDPLGLSKWAGLHDTKGYC